GTEAIVQVNGASNLSLETLNGPKWNINIGSTVTLNPDQGNEETVTVTKTQAIDATLGPNEFKVIVNQNHNAGEEVICRCWHAPWQSYDVRRDSKVVPYFTVVD